MPAAQDYIDPATSVQKALSITKGQLIDVAQDQALAGVVHGSSAIESQVIVVLRSRIAHTTAKSLIPLIVINRVGISIGGQERKPIGKPLVELQLEGMIVGS